MMGGETDLARFTRRMNGKEGNAVQQLRECSSVRANRSFWSSFPFASISVFILLLTLFLASMERGGWTWSSWTYAFSFVIFVPLVIFELKRRAVITGGAIILLFFMVLIDAGMPGAFGYSPSDNNWYDNWAHLLGTLALTLFLWSFMCWALHSSGPDISNGGRRMLWLAIATMAVVSFIFEFTEFFTDAFFGWTNFHPGIDTAGDLIFDSAGIIIAGLLIGRHGVSALRRPFWHSENLRSAPSRA